MNLNFELILFYAVIICGLIYLFDILFLAKKRKENYARANKNFTTPGELKLPILIDYARSFFPILLIVFLLRSFLFEPFRIPSASLEPTLLTGDFIVVNKYIYGERWPVIHKKFIENKEPKRGDIFVFRWPPNPSIDFIKRVIGVPGDHIKYVNKVLFVNGKEAPQTFVRNSVRIDEQGNKQEVVIKEEDLLGVKHDIYQNTDQPGSDFEEIVVPPGMYFAMGDNRDDSGDSRAWGFVPEQNIIGKAVMVWMSWDSNAPLSHKIRWDRIGKTAH